jgi:hypothetical protein
MHGKSLKGRYADGGETGFDDEGTSMGMYHEKKGNFIVPKGQIYLWLYDNEDGASKMNSGEYDYVFYPYASMSMAWQRGFIPPLKRIWTKKFQKEHKGSEHLLGVIKAYLIEDGKVIKTEFFNDPKSDQFISLRDKTTFVRTYACFDFDWTTKSVTKYCSGAIPSNTNTNTTNIDDNTLKSLMGNYVSDKKTDGEFKIFESTSYTNIDEPIQLGISSYSFSYVSGTLDNPRYEGQNLTFDISIDTSREDILQLSVY